MLNLIGCWPEPSTILAVPGAHLHLYGKAPRPGRNPRTGEAIPIKARHVVTFHASHKLKGVVQGDTPIADEFE